jgi:hypothetical protein
MEGIRNGYKSDELLATSCEQAKKRFETNAHFVAIC